MKGSHNQNSETGNKMNGSSTEYTCTGSEFAIETLMEEVKPVKKEKSLSLGKNQQC